MKTEAIALFLENDKPWPAWFGWLEHRPVTKGLQVQFLVRAHTWVMGLIPGPGMYDLWSGCTEKATN